MEVHFKGVDITIEASSPEEAYFYLCKGLNGIEMAQAADGATEGMDYSTEHATFTTDEDPTPQPVMTLWPGTDDDEEQ